MRTMRHKGQSFVEVLISVGLVALFVIAAAGAIAPSLQTNKQAARVQAKAQLGNELLQNVKAWAGGNWNKVLSLATGTGNPYYLDDTIVPPVIATGTQTEVVRDTFARYFYLSDVYRDGSGNATATVSGNFYDPSTKQITVVAQSASSTGVPAAPIAYVGYLVRTASNVLIQTTWSGDPNRSSPVTLTNGDFATSSNIALPSVATTYYGTGNAVSAIAFDGTNMWTANTGDNSVTKISPTGTMDTYSETGSQPVAIAFDGTNMWTANIRESNITKISPTGTVIGTYSLAADANPSAIAFNGTSMWTADAGARGVTKINITTGTTTPFGGITDQPIAIAFDGTDMWTANINRSVTKVSPTGTIMATYFGTGAGPNAIAFDGTNMWTTNGDDDSVTKVSPAGVMATYTGTGAGPDGIAFDGTNMWTVNQTDKTVTKVSPTGVMTTYTGTGNDPYDIAFDGTSMWVPNFPDNSVTKFTVPSMESITLSTTSPTVATTVYPGTGSTPYNIFFDGTYLWTPNYSSSSVTKIDPATGATTTYDGFPSAPAAIASDTSNNLWTANFGDNSVTKFNPTTLASHTYGPTQNGPSAIARDASNNMWTANTNDNSVTKISPAGATTNYPGTGSQPVAIAFDGDNMWTANQSDDTVTRINATTGATTTFPLEVPAIPYALAFDGNNILVAEAAGRAVTRVNPTTGATSTCYIGEAHQPNSLAFDASGNVWTAEYNDNSVARITPACVVNVFTGIADAGDGPSGIAFDGTHLWTSNYGHNNVTKITFTPGGYVATGTLDSATFDTGVASGTQLNSFIWQGNADNGTAVKFQFAVGNSATGTWNYKGPGGDASTYFTGNPGTPISLIGTSAGYVPFAGYRYFRYRVTLYADGSKAHTPTVNDVAVNWSQ